MEYEIKNGLDGKKYAVFKDEISCDMAAPIDAIYACFDGFNNAYEMEK